MMKKLTLSAISMLLLFSFGAASGFADQPFKIGLMVPLSGAYTDAGQTIKDGIFLRMKEAG